MIIDCHCHAGEGDGLTGPWDTAAVLDRYLARAEQAGIDHSVLLPAFHSRYDLANRKLAEIVRRGGGRFSGFAMVHALHDAGRIDAMVRVAVERYGFCGLKVHRHDGRLTREICRAARRHRLPILYDPMGEIGTVELAAMAYPDVSFIIPHLGSFADDWNAQRALIDVVARRANVFADSSGVRRFDLLEEVVQRGGAHKLLFGSDGPWLHPGVELAKIRALGLALHEEGAVLGGNWLRLTRAARRPGISKVADGRLIAAEG